MFPVGSAVSALDRARAKGHASGVFWMTGLPGSGKSTLARATETLLFGRGMDVSVLDGDTLRARCDGQARPLAIRLRGVDTDERGQHRWHAARDELRRRTAGQALAVLPHHGSHRRVVADVLAAGVDVGAAMDAAGWSKAGCPKR